jgi:hypothetical protein
VFDLPKSTELRKLVHKKVLYQKYATELSGDKKENFDADISRIIITNEISETSVNIKATEKISSIFVVQIEMKTKEYSDKNIIMISRLFGQNLLLVLHCGDKYQLAIYETKLLKSDWKTENEISLKLSGLDMQAVWDNFVTQVSGINAEAGNTLAEQISMETEKDEIRKQIENLEHKARRETQSKKKFEMFQRIKEYQRRLEEMK